MEIPLNWFAIIIISLVTFGCSAVWHGQLFGKLWMRIHHGDKKMTDAEMKKATAGMWKIMCAELVATILMVITLDFLINILPSLSGIHIGFLVWIGFILPTMISTVIWGNDDRKWMPAKIAISASFRLVSLLFAGYILSIW